MSRQTTARRGAISVLAATTLVPGFALGIAQAAATDPAVATLSVSAVKASATEQATFTITGKNFADVTAVKLTKDRSAKNPVYVEAARAFVMSPTRLVVKLPPMSPSDPDAVGRFDVVVFEGDDTSSADVGVKDDLHVVTRPAIAAATVSTPEGGLPDSGPASNGVKLTVSGSGFPGTSKVVFTDADGVEYPVKGFKVISETVLEVTTGELPSGTVHLRVTNAAGTNAASAESAYTANMVVAKAAPALVSDEGEQIVTVTGSGLLKATRNGDVSLVVNRGVKGEEAYYDVLATDFIAASNVELAFTVPAATAFRLAGSGADKALTPAGKADDVPADVRAGDSFDIVVSNDGATASTFPGHKPVKVQYAPVPVADFVVPGVALGATSKPQTVALTGRNLQGAKVKVGNTFVTVTSTAPDGTSLVFRAPVNRSGTPTTRDVVVTTSKGSTVVGKLHWTAAQTVNSVQYSASRPGWVEITGTGLSSVSAAGITSVDGKDPRLAADGIEHVNDSLIRVHLPEGAHQLRLKNAVGTETSRTVTANITSAVYNPTTKVLTISGTNVGGVPQLTLDGYADKHTLLGESTFSGATYQLFDTDGSFGAPDTTNDPEVNGPQIDERTTVTFDGANLRVVTTS